MIDIHEIADNADMIVIGYAFTKCDGNIRVLNLNNVESAAVINAKDEVIETTMDEIEKDFILRKHRMVRTL
ncbi:MAG: hypothetical protein HDT42_08800 [Ruminococcaceae bacterium]|nr:hypothetical protein [Oscillospiraceae bacterium]